jgi:hypothetical protein
MLKFGGCLLAAVMGSAVLSVVLIAEETPVPAATPSASDKALQHMRLMECRLPAERGREARVLPMTQKPLLVFSDPARKNSDGSVWAWPAKGRPMAVVELFRATEADQWIHAITLTSKEKVELEMEATPWQPRSTQIEWVAAPEAPVVDSRPPGRLRQMKELARKFSAHEFWNPNNSRFELRMLISPIHRYDDAAAGIVDGAVFALAHGTNPEVLLLVEAIKEAGEDKAIWNYGIVRLGSAEMHVELSGREVWTVPRVPSVVGQPGDPYWLFWTTDRVESEKPEKK